MEGPQINITMPDYPPLPDDANVTAEANSTNATETEDQSIPVTLNLTESGLVFKPADANDTNATDSFVEPPENLHELPNVTIAGVTYLPPQPVVTMPNVTIDGVLYTATPAEEKAPNATEMEPVIPLVTVLPLEQQNASALNATLPAPEVAPEKLDIIHSLDLGSSDQDYVPSNYTEDPSDPEEVKDVKR
jgi:hypothetical protein